MTHAQVTVKVWSKRVPTIGSFMKVYISLAVSIRF